ncbi:MAG: FAD-dependent monooxygenase [Acetobacteraceae bacterium]|nr:FAD-dependent monooxygenase [Acetobacteraceae bacterium]
MKAIVVGAGPVGLTAALILAEGGAEVTLVEKREGLNTASRASTFHPPTIEILDRLGCAGPLLAEGVAVERIQYRTPEGVAAEFALALLAGETRFPCRRHLEQARVTPALLARLARRPNARLRFGAEVVAVEQDGQEVRAVLAGGERLGADALIAADGAHSRLRAALGIGFPGFAYPHRVLRLMTEEDPSALLPGLAPISYLHRGGRSLSFLRMPECWRIIIRVPPDTPDSAALDDGWILARLGEVLPHWSRLPRTLHRDLYAASRHLADRFHEGRVLLAGDAAHLTNTRGGMNMNAGIHDAWAIARALLSGGLAAARAAAEARRRIAAEKLLPRTDRSVTGGEGWLERVRAIAADPAAARAFLREGAMLDMVAL